MISIPNYTIEKEIGRGGMATVYLAIQDKLKRKVALKIMTPEMAKDENFRKSFMSEATIIASLDHPNIVRIYDVEVVDDSTLYMAMEYLSGGTLKEKLLNGKKISLTESIKLIEQISNGLSHAHEKGYIHRDIKPGNILFRSDGSAVLTDFGIAKLEDTSGELTKMGFTMGTLQYMSPEQVVTTNLDQRSDIYSLGLVFYEMLTGLKAFRAESTVQAIHQHTTVPPPKLEGEYSYLQPVIDKVLSKLPEDRYQKVLDFVSDIKESGEADKTVIHRLADDDKTQIFTPDATDQVVIPEKELKKSKKTKTFAIVVAGALFVGGGAFTAYKLMSRDDVSETAARLVNTPEEIVPEKEKTMDQSTNKVSYFHEPQIKYAKFEYELDALQKTTKDLLSISPDNQKAQGTLKLIASKYNRLAEDSLKAMNIDRAIAIIDKGLSVSNNDISLTQLKRQIDNKDAPSEAKKTEIKKLFMDAQKYVKNGNYVLPLGKNALEKYQTILLIEPGNTEAIAKINHIKTIFEKLIKASMGKDNADANELVNQARALFPYDEKFIQLQQKIKNLVNH